MFCCKQKTAYEMRISGWSSDVCSSDLGCRLHPDLLGGDYLDVIQPLIRVEAALPRLPAHPRDVAGPRIVACEREERPVLLAETGRSEEHTSELQSLMRISYAVFCLNTKNREQRQHSPLIK